MLFCRGVNKVDLISVPTIDSHCHPFAEEFSTLTVDEVRSLVTLSATSSVSKESDWSLLLRLFLNELSEFLECEPRLETVVETRNVLAQDYPTYLASLFRAVNLRALLFDRGYPFSKEISLEECTSLLPDGVEGFDIFRVESVFSGYRELKIRPEVQTINSSFDLMIEEYGEAVRTATRQEKCMGLKTVQGAFWGLEIRPVSYEDARRAYDTKEPNARWPREVWDYLFLETARLATELRVPLQVHTGLSGLCPWPRANPIHLQEVLDRRETQDTIFILLHAGYPYLRECGYLVSRFPNVYCDISLVVPFSCAISIRSLEDLMEIAPLSKIMWGSDSTFIPEMNWISAKVGKKVLSEILKTQIKAGLLTSSEADEAARMILYETAKRLYKL